MSIEHAERVQVKLFAEPSAPPAAQVIPVFHGWITHKKIDNELLIDVADYSHVHDGPGVILIGHGGDYYYDEHEGRRGILFSRKRALEGDLRARLSDALRRALYAAQLLQSELRVGFGTDELLVRVPDRLHAPSTDESFAELVAVIREVVAQIFGSDAQPVVERVGGALDPLSARVRIEGAPQLGELHARLH